MTIRARDVRTLLQLSDPWHRSEPVELVWESALSTIKALIPCDAVSFPIQDVAHGGCVSREFTDKYETYLDPGACSDDAAADPKRPDRRVPSSEWHASRGDRPDAAAQRSGLSDHAVARPWERLL